MSKDFDKTEPQTPGKVEFIGHTAKHIPGALRYKKELGRPMFSILDGKHTKPECSCGLRELYDSERFHIQCDTTISKGHFVNKIIEAINANFHRESLVFDLGSDAAANTQTNFFVRCDGTVFVNGKSLKDGGPPEQRLQQPKPQNRNSRPPPWPENPLRQQWLNWIHTVLFGSRNLPSVQEQVQEQEQAQEQ